MKSAQSQHTPDMAGEGDTRFFGHPVGLGFLAFTEVWERLSFYGMQALLPLYMARHLFKPENIGQVIGFAQFRSLLESPSEPLSVVALTSQIFGLYAGFAALVVLAGGWIGDRILGRTRAVLTGGAVMAIGHFLMAFEALFLFALVLLILGGGLFKGNLVVQVGGLYGLDDQRRRSAFGVYGVAVQTGALLAPVVCGTLGELYGWHFGFGAAAAGMVIALGIYLSGLRHLPHHVASKGPASSEKAVSRRSLPALFLVLLSYTLMITAVLQAYVILLVWAVDNVQRNVASFTVPVTWVLVFDGLASILAMLVVLRLWAWQRRVEKPVSDYNWMVVSGVLCSLCFVVLYFSDVLSGPTSLATIAVYYSIIGFGIAFLDPSVKSITIRSAPASMTTTMIGFVFAAFGLAHFGAGWVGRFYEPLGSANFWLLNAAIAGTGSIILLATRRWTERRLYAPAARAPGGTEAPVIAVAGP